MKIPILIRNPSTACINIRMLNRGALTHMINIKLEKYLSIKLPSKGEKALPNVIGTHYSPIYSVADF